jgi:outer membrane protein TolC
MKNSIALFLYIPLFSCALFAEESVETRKVSLDEYKNLAVANSLDVHLAQYDLDTGKQVKNEAFTHYFPTITGFAGLLKPNVFGNAQATLDANIEIPFTYIPPFRDHVSETINFDDDLSASAFGVTITQPIFAGGRIFNSNRLAKKGVEASAFKLQMKKNEVYAQAEQKYYQYVLLHQLIKTFDVYTETLTALYNQVSQAVGRGVASRSDFLRVQLKQEELAIQRFQAAQLLIVAEKDLKLFAGISDGRTIVANDDFGAITEPAGDSASLPAHLSSRPEFQLLTIQHDAARLQKLISAGTYLPSVEIGASIFRTDYKLGGHFVKNATGYYYDTMGFILFNVPVSDWWPGYYKIKESDIAEKSSAEQLGTQSKYLLLDMENKLIRYETAFKQVRLAEIGLEYAQTNCSEYADKYRAGISVLADYLQALGLQYENETKLNQAKADYLQARTAFLIATGKTF